MHSIVHEFRDSPEFSAVRDLVPDDWQGEWIGSEEDISAPLLRKEFTVEKEIDRARVYICGLGYYQLYINGRRVDDRHLDPAQTDYKHGALYSTFDVGEHSGKED